MTDSDFRGALMTIRASGIEIESIPPDFLSDVYLFEMFFRSSRNSIELEEFPL